METLYIIIPAYNEESNIAQVIMDWYPIVEQYHGNGMSRLVIIDDGSKDRTYDIMQEYAKDRPLLLPITKTNSGHGATVLYGYHYALAHHADYVFQTDSDGQTLPSEFHPFWNERNNYDMLIGWRNHREDGLSRVFVTQTLKLVLWFCFGVRLTDANTPYRLMAASSLQKYIEMIPENHHLSNVLLSVVYAKAHRKMKYIPITFRPRQGGVNSINIKKIVKIGFQAITDFHTLNKKYRSLT